MGQVNNYALAAFVFGSGFGSLQFDGVSTYTLDGRRTRVSLE